MIERNLGEAMRRCAAASPVVAVTGPRQAGKTTLCRQVFGDLPYVSLEAPDQEERVRTDPRGFLAGIRGGAILDEIQRVPELLRYLQVEVDEDPRPGRFILTGSQQFVLSQGLTQSLAGRVALLTLLPPSLDELRRFPNPPQGLLATLWMGSYPRIHDRSLEPTRWLADYVATYVERDVRALVNVGELHTFHTFLRLCAGRTGQELNVSALAGDAGIAQGTVRAWLSVLETSRICFRVPAWHRNVRKGVVKAPKLHFFDSGLACHLLAIRSAEQLELHPLRGAIFESWVAAELYKARAHRGRPVDLFHVRDARRLEVDLLLEGDSGIHFVEAKSGATVHGEALQGLLRLQGDAATLRDPRRLHAHLIHGGVQREERSGVDVRPWDQLHDVDWS